MSKIEILELIQQDIADMKGLVEFDKYGLTKEKMKLQARGIILNLEEHIEELVKK